MYTEAAWSFRARFIYIFTWHGGSYCIDWLYRNRLHSQRPLLFFFFFFFKSTGLQSSLTWIERYGDERIGCTETIAVGERFLAWGWTCSRNALQNRYRASLGRGKVANNIWVSISFLGNCCFPSEGLYEPSETKSVKHKGPATQLLQLHYAFHTFRCQRCFCFNRKSPELQTQETVSCLVAFLPSPNFHIRGELLPHWASAFLCQRAPASANTFYHPRSEG